ncbi:MAG: hypothetical protein HOH43_26225 [Candidatus Latescibacteria bacterium]|jgi:LDH2 family malate/lactate/ureidoglycolate dehydrogenase|nr:hypothetical protein [Candidatus Latescibacterota bacterium]
MNRPPEEYVHVTEDKLLAFAVACFESAGLDHEHAHTIGRLLVNSDMRGVRTHGTRAVNRYCRAFEEGNTNPQPDVRQIHEAPTGVVIDGDGTLGYLPMVRATEAAIDRASKLGLGIGIVRHIGHYGSAGHYTRMCMDAGCIGFSVQGYRNHGDASALSDKPQIGYFGNPPLSFGMPAGEEHPIVQDVATRILADYQRSPEFDDLLSRIPAAFFKSIGYGAVAIVLGGALAGFSLPSADEIEEKWPSARHGGMVLAIHIESFIGTSDYSDEVDRLVRDVRNTYEPMPGYDEALFPGAVEEKYAELHKESGIRYGESEQTNAREVSDRLGVALPWDE